MGTRRVNAVPVVTGILLLGAALRFYHLGADSLWYDETVSAYLAGLSVPAMLAHTAGDIHPPLYYGLLHAWTMLAGSSEFALAFLSFAFGLLIVAATQRLARHLAGKEIAWLAALLAAISPFGVWYSQEVRMYTLGSLLALASTYAMMRVLSPPNAAKGGRRAWWLVYVAAAACGIYSLYYFFFVLAFQNLFALTFIVGAWKRRMRPGAPSAGRALLVWAAAQSALFLLYLPWLPVAFRQATEPPVPPWRGSIMPLQAAWEAWGALAAGQSADPSRLWPFFVLLLGLYLLGLHALATRPSGNALSALLIGGYTLVPLAIILGVSLFTPLYHVRYAFTYSAAVPVVLAAGLAALSRHGRVALAAGVLAVLLPTMVSLQAYYSDPAYASDDHRAAVRYLSQHWRPGDAVLVNAGYVYPAVTYYYDGPISWRGRLTEYRDAPATEGAVLLQTGAIGGSAQLGWGSPSSDFYATSADETIAALDRAAARHRRIWVYRCYDTVTDPDGAIRRYLDANYRKLYDEGFSGSSYIRVQLYEPLNYALSPADIPRRTEGPDEFAAQVRLLGSDLSGAGRSGAPLYVTLYWQAQRQLDQDLQAFVILRDDAGVAAQWDARPVGSLLPSSLWTAGEVLRDPWRLDLPVGLPPGTYRLTAGLYRPTDGQRLGLLARDGVLGSYEAVLGTVTIERGAEPADSKIPAQHRLAAALGDRVQIAGYSAGEERLSPGSTVRITVWWRALANLSEDYTVFVQLLDPQSKPWAAIDATPWHGAYPTTRWTAGEVVRDWYDLTLAPDAPDGEYRIVAGMYRTSDKARLPRTGLLASGDSVTLGTIAAAGSPRSFVVPKVQRPLDYRLGDNIRLFGYDVQDNQSVTLHWQSLGPAGGPLKVFFHVVDASGKILAQHDGVPAGGLFPTSGWAKGQVLADLHPLGFDPRGPVPDQFEFVVGMYDPVTGIRLPVYDAQGQPLGDSIRLSR